MSTARQERRIAARDRLRERLRAERLAESERPRQRAREAALLRLVDGLECPQPVGAHVLLLAEDTEPAFVGWPAFPVLAFVLGFELHEDTLAAVDRVHAEGGLPAITHVNGWLRVHAKKIHIMRTHAGLA